MRNFFNAIRIPVRNTPQRTAVIHTIMACGSGLIIGASIKLLDLYTTNAGNLFSQTSVWIFLCTAWAALSSTPKRAAVRVFVFCSGMLLTYYLTAAWTDSVYSVTFIYGWSVVAFLSPCLAVCVWYARGNGWIANTLCIGILGVMLIVAVLLFDKIRLSDIVFVLLTGLILLKKNHAPSSRNRHD